MTPKLPVAMTGQAINACASLSVATYAPPHLHRGNSFNPRHFRNLSVALLTSNTGLTVPFVVKLKVVGHDMNLHPRYRLSPFIVVFELLNVFLAFFAFARHQSRVTPHASFLFRNRCIRRFVHRPVAILALHLVLLNMDNVTKINRLLGLVAPRSLLRTKIMEVIRDVQVPQGSLTVIVNSRPNTYRRIIRGSMPLLNRLNLEKSDCGYQTDRYDQQS